jgi:hypothetical protein
MVLEPCRGGILITVGDVGPQLATDECGKEATRVGGADDPGMFSGGDKGETCTVALANESLLVCLLEESEKARRITEIFGDKVLQCRRRGGGLRCVCLLGLNTSFFVRGKGCSGRWGSRAGGFHRLRGLLVLKFLKGFPVFLKKGW